MTAEEYEVWLAGKAPVDECVRVALKLLGEETDANPSMDARERYALVLGSMTACVEKDLKNELFALIRAGGFRDER